jgi:hypothetical protein
MEIAFWYFGSQPLLDFAPLHGGTTTTIKRIRAGTLTSAQYRKYCLMAIGNLNIGFHALQVWRIE